MTAASAKARLSLGEMVALLVTLPPLAYAFGFLMWAGPSRAAYGANVSHLLPASALLFPGTIYLVVLGLSVVLAASIGPARLTASLIPSHRALATGIEALGWFLLIGIVSVLGREIAYREGSKLISTGPIQAAYVFAHVAVMGFGFRRLYGLVRARWSAPEPDRRAWTPAVRLAHATVLVLVLYAQVPFALLFGVLGPNPAKNNWPIRVRWGDTEMRLALIAQTSDRLIAFDPDTGSVLSMPLGPDVIVIYEQHSSAR